MTQGGASEPLLRVAFKLPRSEMERAAADADAILAERGRGLLREFDREHLFGEVTFTVRAPFASDPVLDHLRKEGKVSLEPPVVVRLRQPVAYLIAQLAGAMVMARHGEGAYSIPLAGGKGAVTVGYEDGQFHLGIPLESYAGVASFPAAAAEEAVAAACRELEAFLRPFEWTASWPGTLFLGREAAILTRGPAQPSELLSYDKPLEWDPAVSLASPFSGIPQMARLVERLGAHIVPYWNATAAAEGGEVAFAPLKTPGRGERAGALALCIFPQAERRLELHLPGDADGERTLRARLRRQAPFSAMFAGGRLVKIVEATSELPMA